MSFTRLTGLSLLIYLVALSTGPTTAFAGPAEDLAAARAEQRERSQLQRQARSSDPVEAIAALQGLAEGGEKARATLRGALQSRIDRSRRPIERVLSDIESLRSAQEKVNATRDEATKHADAITEAGLRKARENFQLLDRMHSALERRYERLADAYAEIAIRDEALRLWSAHFADEDSVDLEAQTEFSERIAEEIGISGRDALKLLAGPESHPPARWVEGFRDTLAAELALRLVAERQAEFNGKVGRAVMSKAELEHAEIVNTYRIALGRLPLELDPRIVQAARRHSKEMVDRGYFSHDSPVSEHKTFAMRMAKAGYRAAGGENIAKGNNSPEATFWQWFNSPGHHKNMVFDRFTTLGVGKWGNTWTQNFGRAARVMHLSSERQAEIMKVEGPVLKPR